MDLKIYSSYLMDASFEICHTFLSRWGHTPESEAEMFGHTEIYNLFRNLPKNTVKISTQEKIFLLQK